MINFNSMTKEGWGKSISGFPGILESEVEAYFSKAEQNVRKGQKFFREGYVTRVLFHKTPFHPSLNLSSTCCFQARCYPSMKRGTGGGYPVKVAIDTTTRGIIGTDCGCPAGLSGTCHHVAGLLYSIIEFTTLKLDEIPDNKSCTDKPCSWIRPSAGTVSGIPLTDLGFVKQKKNQKINPRAPSKAYDPRPQIQRRIDENQKILLFEKLSEANPTCAFVTHFHSGPASTKATVHSSSEAVGENQMDPFQDDVANQHFVDTPDSTATLGQTNMPSEITVETNMPSEIAVQNNMPSELAARTNMPNKLPAQTHLSSQLPVDHAPVAIASNHFQLKVNHYIEQKYPTFSDCQVKVIEMQTRGQSSNPSWFHFRAEKLTASQFGRISKLSVSPDNLLRTLLYDNFKPTKGMIYGSNMEERAAQAYAIFMEKMNNPVEIEESGLFVCKDPSFLAASPDRIVYDINWKSQGLLEIKCPASKKGTTVIEAVENDTKKTFCLQNKENQLQLKKNHIYFYQIQGCLAITGLKWCDLFIYNGEKEGEQYVERITFDETFWKEELLPSLTHFFKYAYVPEKLLQRVKHQKSLYTIDHYTPYKVKKQILVAVCQNKEATHYSRDPKI